jgi:hypothetical protein
MKKLFFILTIFSLSLTGANATEPPLTIEQVRDLLNKNK